jgi:hypothetical protein
MLDSLLARLKQLEEKYSKHLCGLRSTEIKDQLAAVA